MGEENLSLYLRPSVKNQWAEQGGSGLEGRIIPMLGGISPEPPQLCYGCGVKFSISHKIDFKRGGLAMTCKNKLCGVIYELTIKTSTPFYVRNNPLI